MLLMLVAGALGACESSTSPGDRLSVVPGEARPFSVVEVRGLPDEYRSGEPIAVTVDGTATTILWDEVDAVHRLAVPMHAPGEVELVVPDPDGAELRTRFSVLAPQYAGGSPAAAVEEMGLVLDSVQIQSVLAQRRFHVQADSALVTRLDDAVQLSELAQGAVRGLAESDRATVAALYSELAPGLREAASTLAVLVADMDALPPVRGLLAQQTPLSASAVVRRCVDHKALLERLKTFQEVIGQLALVSAGIAVLTGPVGATVAAMMAAGVVLVDVSVLLVSAQPDFLDDDGLRLAASPVRVRHDGGTGELAATVRRQTSGSVLFDAAAILPGLTRVRDAFRGILRTRDRLARDSEVWDWIREQLEDLSGNPGLDESLDRLQADLEKAVREASGSLAGEVPVTFDGVVIEQDSRPGRWRFTGPVTAARRAFETVGRNTQAIEPVTLAGRMGSEEGCRAATAGASAESGQNGFEIATEGTVRFGAAPSITLTAGTSGTLRVSITNEGGLAATPITYRLATAAGSAWSPPPWLSGSLPVGAGTLQPRATATLSIPVSAAATAPEQTVVIPLQALVGGKVTATTSLAVTIAPQLSDLVVNREQSSIRMWDHGTQDGDLVTVTLNGSPIATGFSLTNAGTTFPVTYRRGRNVLVVRALNEGSLVPNTAALGFANVVRGTASQTYELPTGGTVQLTITFDPAAQQVAPANGALPRPQLTPCRTDGPRDCSP